MPLRTPRLASFSHAALKRRTSASVGRIVTAVTHEGAKHSSGVHAGELGPVADEDHLGLRVERGRHEFIECERRGQTGLVDHDQLTGAKGPASQCFLAAGDSREQSGTRYSTTSVR